MVNIADVPLVLLHTFLEFLAILDDAALDHLTQQVVTLTGTLSYTGEHRETVVTFGDIVDELHDKHGLAHAGTTEQTDLATLRIGFEQVDHLDTGEEHLLRDGEFVKLRGRLMDRPHILPLERAEHVDGLANHIEQTSLDLIAGRHRDGMAEVLDLHATAHTIGALHSDASHNVFADVLLDFENQFIAAFALNLES